MYRVLFLSDIAHFVSEMLNISRSLKRHTRTRVYAYRGKSNGCSKAADLRRDKSDAGYLKEENLEKRI